MFGLSSIYTTLIGGALLAIASFGGGFYLEHRLAASTIAEMKLADAQARCSRSRPSPQPPRPKIRPRWMRRSQRPKLR